MATKLYVGNLSYSCTDNDLAGAFRAHGEVTSAKVVVDTRSGRSKGFGFVEMDADGAQRAISALNGTELAGRTIKVAEAKPREEGGGGFGGGGGGGGGGDRERRPFRTGGGGGGGGGGGRGGFGGGRRQ